MHLIAPGPLAGAERVVLTGTEALVRAGVDVDLVAIEELREPRHARAFVAEAAERGVAARTLVARGRIDPSLAYALALSPHDVVHVHGYKALAHALPGVRSSPLVCTWHGSTADGRAVRAYEALALRAASLCDRVIAVGGPLVAALVAAGISPRRVAVVDNPVSVSEVPVAPVIGGARPLRALYAGRLSHEKGLDLLLEALALPEAQEVVLEVAGDGPLRASLEAAASRLGLSSRVRFLGWLPATALALQEADVLVLPSRREGLALVALEAAAAGRPIVATSVGAIREVVRDGVNGLLCAPEDVPALARALGRAHRERDGLAANASALSATIRDRFSARTWATRSEEIYGDVLRERSDRLAGLRR